jgi:hypothetical protein
MIFLKRNGFSKIILKKLYYEEVFIDRNFLNM